MIGISFFKKWHSYVVGVGTVILGKSHKSNYIRILWLTFYELLDFFLFLFLDPSKKRNHFLIVLLLGKTSGKLEMIVYNLAIHQKNQYNLQCVWIFFREEISFRLTTENYYLYLSKLDCLLLMCNQFYLIPRSPLKPQNSSPIWFCLSFWSHNAVILKIDKD